MSDDGTGGDANVLAMLVASSVWESLELSPAEPGLQGVPPQHWEMGQRIEVDKPVGRSVFRGLGGKTV